MSRKSVWIGIVLCVVALPCYAAPITFSASSGTLAANAVFDIVGGNLQVTLTNTSSYDVLVPADVLTAVFFNMAGNPTLTPLSVVLASGSTVLFPFSGTGTDPGGVVGGEFAYKSGLTGAPGGASYGVSNSGLSPLFGPPDLFPGTDLQSPLSPDGIQYGITSAGDNPATGNTPVTGTNALIKNSVVITLSGLQTNFDLANISNVSFQYGTDLSEPNIKVPEAGALLLFGTGLVGLVGYRRVRRMQ
jgi:hypothetical protein